MRFAMQTIYYKPLSKELIWLSELTIGKSNKKRLEVGIVKLHHKQYAEKIKREIGEVTYEPYDKVLSWSVNCELAGRFIKTIVLYDIVSIRKNTINHLGAEYTFDLRKNTQIKLVMTQSHKGK